MQTLKTKYKIPVISAHCLFFVPILVFYKFPEKQLFFHQIFGKNWLILKDYVHF